MLETKALYNLLRINAREDRSVKAERWALEDLRTADPADLWKRLAKKGIALDRSSFIQYAEETDSPEELLDLLVAEGTDSKEADQIYLIVFELWRRFLPERLSPSVFCDELDHQIDLYETDQLESDEPIQDGLSNLADVLEEHVDAGMNPKKAFATLSNYCAHDLESFLYDYISDLLDESNTGYASELIEQFEPFLEETEWFKLLRARLISFTNVGEANRQVKGLLAKNPSLDFLFDVLRFLIGSGEMDPFRIAMQKILPQVRHEDELQEVMEMTADYYRRLDCDDLEQAVLMIKKQRKPKTHELKPSDSDIKKLLEIVSG